MRSVPLLLAFALAVVLGRYLHFAATRDQIDFEVYRAGGHAIVARTDLYRLRVTSLGLPFTYPPASAVVFVPLALLPLRAGQVLWSMASLVGLCVFVRLTLRRYASGQAATDVSGLLVVLVLVARSDPLHVGLNLGQINVLIALLVIADLTDTVQWIPRGVLVGIAAAFKLTPLFLIAYFAATRRTHAAVVALSSFLAVTAVAWVIAPSPSVQYWLHGYFSDPRRTGDTGYISNQSINGVLVRLTGSPDTARMIWLPLAAVAAAVMLRELRRIHNERPWHAEALALATMLLLSPVSWIHHWILVLPLLVAGFRFAAHQHRWRTIVLVSTIMLSAALWFGIVWNVPNGNGLERHLTMWQTLLGDSDVFLLAVTVCVTIAATRSPASATALPVNTGS